MSPHLLHHLIGGSSQRTPDANSLTCLDRSSSYGDLQKSVDGVCGGLIGARIPHSARVGIYLSKSVEFVATAFGTSKAGGCFVPINPVLKSAQVEHIIRDCDVQVLVTSPERHAILREALRACSSLRMVVLTRSTDTGRDAGCHYEVCAWQDWIAQTATREVPSADLDMAGIFYTSGSTGKPKGVVVSHRNLVSGAASVASYLKNVATDRLLAVLPLSFDAGFSQLTTAFLVGAQVALLDYTLPHEVIETLCRQRITGLTAVPPLFSQLAELRWPREIDEHLRYFANTGGKMPGELLRRLRERVPSARPYLMYGLTEAFRSTYLPPEEVNRRPESIGQAIPNQEVLVLRPDGTPCAPREHGELVHRGSTVSLGYWNDAARTAERFRPLPGRQPGLMLPELAVFSGDTVYTDEDGFLYFVGRKDDMIKSSGYRISPVELEEAVYATGLVAEAAAVGIPDERIGQRIALFVLPCDRTAFQVQELLAALRKALPAYMLPHRVEVAVESLPRNGNSKLDRKSLQDDLLRALNDTERAAPGPCAAAAPTTDSGRDSHHASAAPL